MTARRDVKVTLHLVPFQTSKYSAAICNIPPSEPRRPLEFLLLTPDFPQHMPNVGILLLFLDHVPTIKRMAPRPLAPACRITIQCCISLYAITGRILNVDVQVATLHWKDNVEVYLQFVGHALLNTEKMGFVTGVPTPKLSKGQEAADYNEEQGSVAACGGAPGVGGFRLGCVSGILARGALNIEEKRM